MRKLVIHISALRKRPPGNWLLVWLCCWAASADAQSPTANQVKAVFLYNFSKFVTWPPASSSTPFVIGILGNDPFGNYIDQVVEGEKVGNQTIVIQRYDNADDIKTCHILYINKNNAADITRKLSNRNILTVGDADGFTSSGGIIRFYPDNNKIRLRINLKNARAANLQISSKLLRIADVVE